MAEETVGVHIQKKLEEYIDLYNEFKADPVFKDKADGIILGEIALKKFIWRSLDEQFRQYLLDEGS